MVPELVLVDLELRGRLGHESDHVKGSGLKERDDAADQSGEIPPKIMVCLETDVAPDLLGGHVHGVVLLTAKRVPGITHRRKHVL